MKNKKVKKILNDLIIEKYNMTKLQRILHDLGMTQAYLAQISNLETYQVNKICNGKGKKISSYIQLTFTCFLLCFGGWTLILRIGGSTFMFILPLIHNISAQN